MPMKTPVPCPTNSGAHLITRRQFLAGATALGWIGCRTPKRPQTRALVGTQLYGWTQYYQRAGRDFESHLDEILIAIRDCGYDYAEGFLDINSPDRNTVFAQRLLKNGLRPVSLYTGGRLHEAATASQNVDRLLAAAAVCRQAGFTIINCDPDSAGRDKTDEELRTQSAALIQLGQGLQALGLRLGIHHHTPAMQNGAREFHHNFQHSPAGVVDFCYDVHWVYRGGVLPADALRDYGARVVSWHLRQSRQQIWWEDLAPGDIDYQAVARFAREHQLPPFYTVELALEEGTRITRSARENHARSRTFVKDIFGV
jgi:inosose dehydratase